jgi:hypothetical protein
MLRLALPLLVVLALALAQCGGDEDLPVEPPLRRPVGTPGEYWLDVDRTAQATRAAAGSTLDPRILGDLAPETYRLRLVEDGSFTFDIGEGSDLPVAITGTWEPTEEGVAITMVTLNEEETNPDERVAETLRRDGEHLVIVQGGLHLHLHRKTP